jgi:outer membrane protein assembly factor BamB
MVVQGVSGPGSNPDYHGSVVLLDAATGALVRRVYTIPEVDWAGGYAGAGVWSTAAIDEATGYAYVGTGNPATGDAEHAHANALLKIDLDASRPTFGTVVASYKSNIYEKVPQVAQADTAFDFGASPNLFSDAQGRKLVGDLQRAGVYHGLDRTTMQGAWTSVLGPTIPLGNASTATVAGGAVFATLDPGTLFSLDATSGVYRWASATADGVRYQPLVSANGVVYTVDAKGFLDAYDASSGLPLLHRPMGVGADSGVDPTVTLGGLSIARNTVYGTVGAGGLIPGLNGYVIAFRPDPSIPVS